MRRSCTFLSLGGLTQVGGLGSCRLARRDPPDPVLPISLLPHVPHLPTCATAVQEALMDCVRRVVFQENAPMGRPMSVRILIGRSQEAGALEK